MTIDGYCTIGTDREYNLTVDELLRQLDEAGVERAVVASPDRDLAVDNTQGNDAVLAATRDHSARLIASCGVNPWYGRRGINEARRCAAAGARLLVFSPFVQGFVLGDEMLHPFAELAAEERIPIYVHTGSVYATPFQLALLARRFPEVDWIMGHAGKTDFWNDVPQALLMSPNLYLDRSYALPPSFVDYCEEAGYERGIMGSGAPICPLVFEWNQMRNVLPPQDRADVYGENLRRLLQKSGAL